MCMKSSRKIKAMGEKEEKGEKDGIAGRRAQVDDRRGDGTWNSTKPNIEQWSAWKKNTVIMLEQFNEKFIWLYQQQSEAILVRKVRFRIVVTQRAKKEMSNTEKAGQKKLNQRTQLGHAMAHRKAEEKSLMRK